MMSGWAPREPVDEPGHGRERGRSRAAPHVRLVDRHSNCGHDPSRDHSGGPAPASVGVNRAPAAGAAVEPNMGTERGIALSGEVARRGAHRLDLPPDIAAQGLSVSVPDETNIL